MNFFDEDPYAPQEDRRATVKRELARLNTTPPESPEQAQRKAKASKERLRRHDELFHLDGWGSGLPHVTAGDPDGDRDVS